MSSIFIAFKGMHNTSFQLVDKIERPYILLTNSFSGLERDINNIENNYDAVYMFGVDKNLKRKVRIEKCAKDDENIICTDFDILTLSKRMSSHCIEHQISSTPTRYLCNSAYYHMLCKNKNSLFIHIPSIKSIDDELMEKLINLFGSI